jgi:hypothetical protein
MVALTHRFLNTFIYLISRSGKIRARYVVLYSRNMFCRLYVLFIRGVILKVNISKYCLEFL